MAADKALDVPTVSFRIVTDDKSLLGPAGVHSEQARSYGYNDFSDFERPEHYIRYIEPIESELAVQVEYDMDEQDQEWLEVVNAERKKDQLGPVSYEVFEIIMDKLEKEWFNLIKRVPQPQSHMPVEDSKCAICDDGEGENSNAIVFCDGCNLAVHQDCYGVPYIPEGQWLCRKCTVSPENPVSCLFCPNEGGAFKQTTTGHWSHLLCAIWIPELGVGNSIYMEPVEGVEAVPKNRWKLVCSLCKERVGACIQCEKPSCFTAFHVTCARQMGLLQSMKLMGADGQLKAFCDKHLPADWRDSALGDEEDDESYQDTENDEQIVTPQPRKRERKNSTAARPNVTTITTKTARAHAKSYRPGPPIVPKLIVNRLLDYVAKVSIHKRHPFIERLCRYWSLKREARRGAPLLKRLHLEPWTATTESREQTEAEKAKTLEFVAALRNDLEKVRLLAELVRKREREKLRQAQVIKEVVDTFIFQHYSALRAAFERVMAMDREELFVHPVNLHDVPDYLTVVSDPICLADINEKLEKAAYYSIDEFKRDVNLVFDNAMLYNKADTPFHRRAGRIKKNAQPILAELEAIPPISSLLPEGDFTHPPADAVGDLETSLVRLQALISPDPTDESRDLLASIFVAELEKPKEPTPPPEETPQPEGKKRKHRSAAERKKIWEEREEAYKHRQSIGATRATRGVLGDEDLLSLGDDGTPQAEGSVSATPKKEAQAGPSRRSRRSHVAVGDEPPSAASSPGRIKPMRHPERGVLGIQSIPVLTDRERREQERALGLVTQDLGRKDEYERFNVGWILPEGSRRRKPAPAPPPPKAKAGDKGKAKEVEAGATVEHKEKSSGTSKKRKRDEERDGSPPPPKRSKVDEDDEELTPIPDSAPATATRSHFRSSLTPPPDEDMDVDAPAEVPEAPKPTKEVANQKKTPKKKVKPTEDDPYPPGTQVWAKLISYPYFPAVILDLVNDRQTVPEAVLEMEAGEAAKYGERIWLVRFHDKQQSLGWMPANKLSLLGVDEALDEMYLSGRERGRKKSVFKSSHVRAGCRKAYEEAKAAMQE